MVLSTTSNNHETAADSTDQLKTVFENLYKKWKKETEYLSSSAMFDNKNYRQIVKLGKGIVPYIIDILKKKPDHLFIALKEITGENPIKPEHRGMIQEMANDWIKWAGEHYTA